MIVKTGRFGDLEVNEGDLLHLSEGVIGFPEDRQYVLVDPGDETLILWLQSTNNPRLAFPLLEPKVFKPEYVVRLSAAEERELGLTGVRAAAVFCVLTIPNDLTQMTANLKAPIVINLKDRIARQVVLQENDFPIKHPMFNDLREHLMTIQSTSGAFVTQPAGPIDVGQLSQSDMVIAPSMNA